jgi:hypothetical protein
MPRQSMHGELLNQLDQAALALSQMRYNHAVQELDELLSESSASDSDLDLDPMIITPPSPLTPDFADMSDSDLSGDKINPITTHFDQLQDSIAALWDELAKARVLHQPDEPPPRAPQLHLLVHFEEHCPHLFRQKLRVNPEIFDDILDLISNHPISHNQSHNPQLPVAMQLAIFLNRAGHYGNAISLEDVAQWAGISVGSVVNCTNHVMVAVLAQHDHFVSFPTPDSQDAEHAQCFVESRACPEWRKGIFAVDGSTVDLYAKPGFHGEVFFDRKSKYSVSCQVSILFK